MASGQSRPLPPIPEKPAISESDSQKNNEIQIREHILKLEDEVIYVENKLLHLRLSSETEDDYATIKDFEETEEIDLLLIGKTGNGKSATANSILGQKAFESYSSPDSVTNEVNYAVRIRNGVKIKVVDAPGVGDTRKDSAEGTKDLLTAMSKAISFSPKGYHAFLLVVRFDSRFTKEEMETVATLKKIFGKRFFTNFFIIVMTHGDTFEGDQNDFDAWLKKLRKGDFTDLLQECKNRVVLFDNRTKDEVKRGQQVNNLLNIIESLKRQNCRYSDEHFNTAAFTRTSLLVESEKELIQEEIMSEANMIIERLQIILSEVKCHKSAPLLKDLYERANALYSRIKEKDRGTRILNDLVQTVWSIVVGIREQIKISENVLEETKLLRSKRRKEARHYAQELKRQREEFDRSYLEGKTQDVNKIKMLQEQIEKLNETKEQWNIEEEEIKTKVEQVWEMEKQKAEKVGEKIKELNDIQMKLTHEKVSRGVFAKLKERLFQNKK